jgi:hypothetical protein
MNAKNPEETQIICPQCGTKIRLAYRYDRKLEAATPPSEVCQKIDGSTKPSQQAASLLQDLRKLKEIDSLGSVSIQTTDSTGKVVSSSQSDNPSENPANGPVEQPILEPQLEPHWLTEDSKCEPVLFVKRLVEAGFSNSQILTILELIDTTCHDCWDHINDWSNGYYSRCQCTNDE